MFDKMKGVGRFAMFRFRWHRLMLRLARWWYLRAERVHLTEMWCIATVKERAVLERIRRGKTNLTKVGDPEKKLADETERIRVMREELDSRQVFVKGDEDIGFIRRP